MSFRSKWRQFVGWVSENRVKPDDPMYDVYKMQDGKPADNDPWSAGEEQAAGELSQEGSKYVTSLVDWYAGYLDSKTGNGPPPGKGIVTDNPELDGLVITGVIVAVGGFILKKIFS